jgi:protein-disulfide isomerase
MSKLSIPISANDHLSGDLDAACSLVEYGDYQCPSCGMAYPIVKQLQKHFGKRLLFVFRNFPLSQIHPWAEPAAEAAEFAGQQDKFWEMHDLLYENQESLSDALFSKLAESLGLSSAQMETAVTEHANHARIRADFTGGVRSGVNGTPTFFINGQRHDESYDFETLREAIELAMNTPHKSSK